MTLASLVSMIPAVLGIGLVTFAPQAAGAFESRGRSALIVDHATGVTLYAKNADAPLPPASMSKLMTLYMLFEALRDGRVTQDSEFIVSERAQAMGGSRMFVEAGKRVPVRDLIRGVIVQSGNDACVVIAENLFGSEDAFAAAMTKRARELGMDETTLKNASGWPESGHVMSAEDLVTIAGLIIDEFPQEYVHFAETEFTWNGITQQNRNPLLTAGLGADGLKTGHTSDAGYGLVGSAVQDGQRIVFAISGLDSVSDRAAESAEIVNWAFGAFETLRFFDEGETVAEADVWLGATDRVPLVAPAMLQMLAPRGSQGKVAATVVYDGPIEAPIVAGEPIAHLMVAAPDMPAARFDLVAGADVPRGGLGVRLEAAGQVALGRALALIPQRD